MRAIINAKILCPVNGLIEGGTIIFDDKIQDIGKSVSIPEEADGKNEFGHQHSRHLR